MDLFSLWLIVVGSLILGFMIGDFLKENKKSSN